MRIKTKTVGDVGAIILNGKLMGEPDTTEVHNEVKSFLGENINKIVIDLKNVRWMNSLGVGALMSSYTTVKNHDGDLRLSGLTEKVRSLMLITQLIKVFNTYETVDEAIKSF